MARVTTAQKFADLVNGISVLEKDWNVEVDIPIADITSKYCIGGKVLEHGYRFVDGSSIRMGRGRVEVVSGG